ncbi:MULTISPECIES: D-aminoacylase [unclassified Sphingopyxis]|uniref:N-acyl-D-amino-acid deacylase family protein n=1 Tax=unclassified Sphingopyxis TaxID=2614943 RepID=UPI000731147C|nr:MULTISPECIES: D-aminoacylase [unclassified Sphingopyxis]KTE28000.1 aminoacylase [Sphingopyxis sp. H057]KTE55621.1 aminoacylase [Sphingopyxis sp. H073]KTE57497.1 aminoacylase [Sphingopyxis sp. H071]KTE61584.1 aminoacylase [Sphingopyxis sp. H107]KTE66508.1 aminoacylase [Sphingopyxis sp. H100]
MTLPRPFVLSLMLLSGAIPAAAPAAAEGASPAYDLIIRGGTIYDGSGAPPVTGDVAIKGDRIVAVGTVDGTAKREVQARGMAVAPGFINMLSWATESLIADPRSESDIRQGVTLEVMGEGSSMGPYNATMKRQETERQGDIRYKIEWTSLGDYLGWLEKRGISTNIASFVGAATVRVHELGEDDVDPNPEQLARMKALVRQAMNEGALGVGSSLIYAPGSYAETDELAALMTEAGKCGGMYISHMRSEGDRLEQAVDELIEIARRSGAPAEIYHLKMAGRSNWGKLDAVVKKIEAARAAGLRITTDMYTYTAGATGLDAAMPTWVQAGGLEAWIERLKDPATRARVAAEMQKPGSDWENLYFGAGADKMILTGFKNEALKPLTGKTLAEVAAMRGKSPEETAMDLVIEDGSRVGTVYFLMSEDNVRKQVQLPWMSFGSDAASQSTEGVFLKSGAHPRTYGNFARLLGRYVRDEKLITLEEAVRRLTTLPATNLGIAERGALKPGYYADVVVFDPAAVADRATFEQPHRYAVGMRDVYVNGIAVLKDGRHSGATPGRAVRGKGFGRCS